MNNEKEFIDFYKENFNKLLKFLERNYPNLIDPESHLQDVFIKFYNNYLSDWDNTKSKFITYFTNYLKMETLSKIKQRQKNIPISMDIEIDIGGKIVSLKDILVEENNNNRIDFKLDILNKIIKDLDKQQLDKFSILEFYIKGMSYEEISKHTNLTLNQVKSKIHTIRIYLCNQYSKITGEKIEFAKIKQINKAADYLRVKKWRDSKNVNTIN